MRKVHVKEMTELHFAAPTGHQKVISALLTHSINADTRTDDGMTTIYCIVEKGSIFTTSTATGFEFIIVGWIVVLELVYHLCNIRRRCSPVVHLLCISS